MGEERTTSQRAWTVLSWAFSVLLYLVTVSMGLLLSSVLSGEYFPGGIHWLKPIAAVAIPVALIAADVVWRLRGIPGSWQLRWVLVFTPVVCFVIGVQHHFSWVVPQRIEECGSYEGACDEQVDQPELKF